MLSFVQASLKGIGYGVGITLVLILIGRILPLPEGATRVALSWDMVGLGMLYLVTLCWAACMLEFGGKQVMSLYRRRFK